MARDKYWVVKRENVKALQRLLDCNFYKDVGILKNLEQNERYDQIWGKKSVV